MDRRSALLALSTLFAARSACAQTPATPPHVAFIDTGVRSDEMVEGRHPLWSAVLSEMRKFGQVEGKTFVVDRWGGAGGANIAAYRDLARKVVASEPRAIVVRGSSVLRVLAAETKTIPIVAVASIPSNLYASYARPGGNVTGVAAGSDALTIYSKQVEVLHSALKAGARIAWLGPKVLWESPNGETARKASAAMHAALEPALVASPITKPALRDAFADIARSKPDAVLISAAIELFPYRDTIAELAASHRLPSLGPTSLWAEAGVMISYGADYRDTYRHAGAQLAKILNGANPAVIPIEQPEKVDLVINLQTANSIGVTIPQVMLLRADKVIQ